MEKDKKRCGDKSEGIRNYHSWRKSKRRLEEAWGGSRGPLESCSWGYRHPDPLQLTVCFDLTPPGCCTPERTVFTYQSLNTAEDHCMSDPCSSIPKWKQRDLLNQTQDQWQNTGEMLKGLWPLMVWGSAWCHCRHSSCPLELWWLWTAQKKKHIKYQGFSFRLLKRRTVPAYDFLIFFLGGLSRRLHVTL